MNEKGEEEEVLREPIEITSCRAYDFKLKLDTRKFEKYDRQGVVENKKVPKKVQFDSLENSIQNPVASSEFGMLEVPDMKFFGMGRYEQLHIAVYAVHTFRDETGAYPENKEEDLTKVVEIAKMMATDLKSKSKL
jgi:hypothetical protein